MSPSTAGLVPPHDLDAEAAVLSAMLLERRAIDDVCDMLDAEHFYSDANARIYGAALELYAAGSPVDVVQVAGMLRSRGLLGSVGGAPYLGQLADATPATANVTAHARTVRDKARTRKLIATLQRAAAEGYGDVGDVGTWLDRIGGIADLHEALQALDALMGVVRPGNMVVLGAHSGIGKSALGMQWALNVALQRSEAGPRGAALIFSHEMTRHELAQRALFAAARVDGSKASDPRWLTDDDWKAVIAATTKVALENVYFDDRSGLTPIQIRAKARRVQAQARRAGYELRVIVVDYLQLIDGTAGNRSSERREREVASVSAALKGLAKDLLVPVVVLAQLNDDARKEKRAPKKEDMRECKAVVCDADKVVLIYNEHAARRSEARRTGDAVHEVSEAEAVELIVDKNRGGKLGRVPAMFHPSFTLFTDEAAS